MTMRILVFFALLLSGSMTAQQRRQGEAIVQLKSGSSIDACMSDMNQQLGLLANVKSVQCIYSRMNLWLVSFDEEQINMRDFLYELKKSDLDDLSASKVT